MKKELDAKEVFEFLKKKGFLISVPGFFWVSYLRDFKKFIEDRDGYYIRKHEVSKETFFDWKKFDRHCRHRTAIGDRCRNFVPRICVSQWDPGTTDRCGLHQEKRTG